MVGSVDECENENPWVMVKDKWLAKGVNAKQDVEVQNRFEVLAVETDKDRKIPVPVRSNSTWLRSRSLWRAPPGWSRAGIGWCSTRTAAKSTGERMEVWVKDETFVFDVKLTKKDSEVITLDSGAGVHVSPRGQCEDVAMMPKKEGPRMCAANRTSITNLGQMLIKFRLDSDVGFCPVGSGPRAAHAEDDRVIRPLMPEQTGSGKEDQEDDGVSELSEETVLCHSEVGAGSAFSDEVQEVIHWRNKDEKVMPDLYWDFMFLGRRTLQETRCRAWLCGRWSRTW